MVSQLNQIRFYSSLLLIVFGIAVLSSTDLSCSELPVGCYSPLDIERKELTEEDQLALSSFFRFMLRQSQGGYVLFGVKPVCIEAFTDSEGLPTSNFSLSHPFSLDNDIIRRGLEVWNKLPLSQYTSPVSIVCYNRPDIPSFTCRHLIWVNREAFISVVDQHLQLFQTILGPQVTPEGLFQTITDPDASFFSSLSHNKVLIGIVLGFGLESAIAGSRLELIEIVMSQREQPPYRSRKMRAGFDRSLQPERFLGEGIPIKFDEIHPSFGFDSLAQEYSDLKDRMTSSQNMALEVDPPIPLFNSLKEHPKAINLIKRYSKAQGKIQDLLASGNFLEEVVHCISGRNLTQATPLITSPVRIEGLEAKMEVPFCPLDRGQLVSSVAQLIKHNLFERDSSYLEACIHGMQAANDDLRLEEIKRPSPASALLNYRAALSVSLAQTNLTEGDLALQEALKGAKIATIEPGKLFYRIIKGGSDAQVGPNDQFITVNFSLSYLVGERAGMSMASSLFTELDQSDIIPGLAHGIVGMRVGEIREIYIHADYAYGCRSRFNPGLALLAKVELLAFKHGEGGFQLPPLVPVDTGLDGLDTVSAKELEQLRKEVGFAEGYAAWSFLREGSGNYALDDVVERMRKSENSQFSNDSLLRHHISSIVEARLLKNAH